MKQMVRLTKRASRNGRTFSYVLNFDGPDGDRKRISLGTDDEARAKAERDRMEAALRAGTWDPDETPPPALKILPSVLRLPLCGVTAGIYFLTDNDDVVYIGQSDCVLRRVVRHIEEREKVFDVTRVFWMPCRMDNLARLEAQLIRRLRPRYNKPPGRHSPTSVETQPGSL